jgi:hypothetical protein
MVLGYILICGMGVMEYGAISGCKVYPRQFQTIELCEAQYVIFLETVIIQEGHYIADQDCFSLGTGT